MTKPAISTEGLGKRFRIGETISYRTLREGLAEAMLKPFRWVTGNSPARPPRTDEIWALQDINLEVESGEALGIIGSNGAGKSTLLKVLSGITEPTVGKAETRGRVASLLEVGTGFHPELTGRENVYLNGAILGMPRQEIQRRFDDIVAFSEVERFIDTPVKRYSSGMYMRLAFSVAAHLEPEILLVDEVLAVGDAAFQAKCLGRMSDVTSSGRTILFVSHNMAAVESLCDRAVLLEKGRITAIGTPTEVIETYFRGESEHVAVDLTNRPDRHGNGRVKLDRIAFRTADGGTLETLRCGQEVEVAVDFSAGQIVTKDVEIQVTFNTLHNQTLFKCNSLLSGDILERIGHSGSFVCRIPQFPLPPGEYVVHLLCRVSREICDSLNNATRVRVAGGDFFGSGRLPKDHRGGVLVNHSWRLDLEP